MEIIKPTIVDGIEFYVANNGEAGMSQSGLARLCGIDEAPLRNHLAKLSSIQNGSKTAETYTQSQNVLDSNPVFLEVRGNHNAKIVSAAVCAEVIYYYAHEAKNFDGSIAKFSYKKFAGMGIQKWIHQVTGYSLAGDLGQLQATLNEVLNEVKGIRSDAEKWKRTENHNKDNGYAGLQVLLTEISEPVVETKLLKGGDGDGYFSLSEYLAFRGVTLDKSHLHRFAGLAASTYRTVKQCEPVEVMRESTQGGKTSKVRGYLQSDFPILAIALQKTLGF